MKIEISEHKFERVEKMGRIFDLSEPILKTDGAYSFFIRR